MAAGDVQRQFPFGAKRFLLCGVVSHGCVVDAVAGGVNTNP